MPAGLARLWGLPLVVTEHWTALCRDGVLGQERLRLARRIYEQATLVLPVCEYLGQCIQERTGAAFKHRVVLNAVDDAVFHYESSSLPLSEEPHLLCVARLEAAKDIPTLLNALALLVRTGRRVHLEVIGRGDQQPLIQRAAALGVEAHVSFLGEQPKTAIANAMRSAQVFVLSSLWENSPCVIGEALCCGLPVVATSVGGVPELVPEGAGCLVPPSDPQALAAALAEVLDKPARYGRQAIAAAARKRFSYTAIGGQLDQVYRSVTRSAN
jgi:glycosyltransferase involved in cell wall biosynthesis